MQAVLCDICEDSIRGEAFEIHFIHGRAATRENGTSHIVARDGATMTFLCQRCGSWAQDAMEYLRQGYRGAGGGLAAARGAA